MRSCATGDRSFKFPSTWAWQSIKPGNTVKPVRSTTRAFPPACRLTTELGPISTTFVPLIRIACSFATEPLLMSIRRVVLIRIGCSGGEAANAMPTAISENRPTKVLRIIIPPGKETGGPEPALSAAEGACPEPAEGFAPWALTWDQQYTLSVTCLSRFRAAHRRVSGCPYLAGFCRVGK